MRYLAQFPVTEDMSPISYIAEDKSTETKEQEALWYYNKSRDHDGLPALCELPEGVVFKPLEE
jgi:hypothetical protein